MKVFRKLLIGSVLVGLFLMAGCGGDGDNGGYHIAEYWPLGQGDTWIYGWEERSVAKTYDGTGTETVSGTEIIDGIEAVKLQYSDVSYDLWTNTNGIVQYKEVLSWGQRVFNPPLMIIPAKVSVGTRHSFNSSVTKTYPDGDSYTENLSGETVIEGFEEITVPAGTFPNCLKVKMSRYYIYSNREIATGELTWWLVKDVGIVMATWQWVYSWGETEVGTSELVYAIVGGVNYPGSSAKSVEGVIIPSLSVPSRFAPRDR